MKHDEKIKILFLSAEVAPLAKAGGLGDVAGALPKALGRLGADIRVCLPYYGFIDAKKYHLKKIRENIAVPVDHKETFVSLWETVLPGSAVPVYLIKHDFFNSKNIYLHGRKIKNNKYTRGMDDIKRFTFFSASTLAAAKAINFQPNIIHANDWHAALIGDMIKTSNEHDGFFKNTKVIYTIHNLANQGIAEPKIVGYSRIDPDLPIIKADLKNGDLNFMVQGILASDAVTTVSPSYAKEILTHYQGAGLENILSRKKKNLCGIINGIDTDDFNPASDKFIGFHYTSQSLKNKVKNKLALQKKLGWKPDEKTCLIGLVTRLVWQKGIDLFDEKLIAKIIKINLPCSFVFLGAGEKKYENQLKKLAKKYPASVKTITGFDEKLARQIYAGSDIFLVPSRFEPCGLTQMIAMRYGSVPVVRATGGLKDTVSSGVGFTFKEYSSEAFVKTLIKALKTYYEMPGQWKKIQANGMKRDFSWNKPAKEYLKLYKKLATL
ncbi:MAG: glycogen/starch synthase [Patescibacteria group bacterium]|jgi:starch synthase